MEKLGMNHAKPFVHDYRKPKDAENVLFERMEGAINKCRILTFGGEEKCGLGFLGQHVEEDYLWRVTIS
ncbi:MAG: hypothetical protein KAV87_60395 [Desulfobacteraceae bacterium]|nr:hypothetical protein [Desulfobacteraceae bacterium]